MVRQEAESVLQRTFKLQEFYEEQWEAIGAIKIVPIVIAKTVGGDLV